MVSFYKLLELLSCNRFEQFMPAEQPDRHLEYKESRRRSMLQKRLLMESSASKIAAVARGVITRRQMPENTVICDARRLMRRLMGREDANEGKGRRG
jgi:hypothetical protein